MVVAREELELLCALLEGKLQSLQRAAPSPAILVQGSAFVEDLSDRIDELLTDIADVYEDAQTGDPEDYDQQHKALEQLRIYVHGLHEFTRYFPALERRDIPLGIAQTVQALNQSVLGQGAVDSIIHLDDRWLYSLRRFRVALQLRSRPTRPESVAVQLPGLDATNALLTPILAHEFGHIRVDQGNLVEEVLEEMPDSEWQEIRARYAQVSGADESPLAVVRSNDQLAKWISEAICDAIAVYLTGPSMVLAAACFLPALERVGPASEHPFAADRIHWMCEKLVRAGWDEISTQNFPSVWSWLKGLPLQSLTEGSNFSFYREVLNALEEPIDSVVGRRLETRAFTATRFGEIGSECVELLQAGFPPVIEISDQSDLSVLVLAGWIIALDGVDVGSALARAVSRTDLSRFVVWAVAMSRLQAAWKEADHAPGEVGP